MSSRPRNSPRSAWWTTRVAVLLPALAALLATLVVCFGSPAGATEGASPVTVTRAADTVTAPAGCPHDHPCCTHAEHGVRAVPRTAPHPLPAPLPRTPPVPAPDVRTGPRAVPPARAAPDLHVLQVLRT
ncbi:hypothetical protein ACWC09_16555 [Streptomyces sp. NPDC001617]